MVDGLLVDMKCGVTNARSEEVQEDPTECHKFDHHASRDADPVRIIILTF